MFLGASAEVMEVLRQIAGLDATEQVAELLYRSADCRTDDGFAAELFQQIAWSLSCSFDGLELCAGVPTLH